METDRDKSQIMDDLAYQHRILQDVSRTFALTIPQLPPDLYRVVSNAYLLCRIADTIEDEAALSAEEKFRFSNAFTAVVSGEIKPEEFAEELYPLLTGSTLQPERDLVLNAPRVVRITRSFSTRQRFALERCIRIMSQGMARFQLNVTLQGLEDLKQLDRYCYHVAGVVGEMLTELFCDYSERIDRNREALLRLAVSFGQGLQMTNILKDIWEDRRRGACWLPRDVFENVGFDLSTLEYRSHDQGFQRGLSELIAIAKLHLEDALAYTLLLPREEAGIRRFCLWALGMAVLTLRKIYGRLDFTSGQQVKISRRSVKATVLVTNLAVSRDALLRLLFDYFTRPLPAPNGHQRALST
ncbi:MAG: phytoene/squalene synthase family protein [Gammaproteobacteria bacterium]|nr:phytoene/squalene synthase family protein [Gammaproteobacteria bacterium]MDH3411254.1 phytoene/squalene synthase family protein [Gammaproteobacteria bacterium]